MNTSKVIAPPLPLLLNLRGYNTEISYAKSSSGRSQLIYKNRGETRSFGPNELHIEPTQMGQLVTVQLTKDPASEMLEALTLIVPSINLGGTFLKSDLQTNAIFTQTTKKKGQAQIYMMLCLMGTAEQVDS
jgi:hypothetical protein